MLEELNSRFRRSIGIKLLSMTLVAFILSVPLVIVSNFIGERSDTHDEAAEDISQSWSDRQTLAGPFIIVPFVDTRSSGELGERSEVRHAWFLPDQLEIDGEITPEIRYRSIYEVAVYSASLEIAGAFSAPDFTEWNVETDNILWDEARLIFGVTDMRGIREAVTLSWGDEAFGFSSGISESPAKVIPTGISVPIEAEQAGDFSFALELNGSRALQFVPVGGETTVELTSPWPDPSFDGAFLPDERSVSEEGFEASWHVLDLNRPYGQKWRDSTVDLYGSAFGLSLAVPVDHYLKARRSTRYAFLVVVLTLLTFFLIELRCRKHAHPFQYILIGLALCLFYLLLLSLSEHMLFDWAYLIAGISTVGLTALYVRALFKDRWLSGLTAIVLTGLYGFVFVLIQLEDYALLVGTIGLILLLALTMFLTRNFSELAAALTSPRPEDA
ncbi:MAG: cell envelope integrity protein CreD [Bacteroidota bacterium]|nr:cell envelope integrity protein CreD [Bacteroidota bacterium]